ncbi:nucleoside deaminase [Oceanisphaera pacifica]|uniref:Nucleoside deaminase n=1 Tax=Oceanisphaera pacifica TaxID=2818389 RepID=A0ABS3NGW1_9GAMM|nr:nucleoside deaminase [Oceanisphaera pacifica]MBO1519633.1 nucleoside deaminase [Oceanisphaera pacifica]
MSDVDFIKTTIELARDNVARGGQPFGALLVQDGKVLSEGVNESYIDHDCTAHAEIQAIRNAGKQHQTSSFVGSTMYASGKPCAMCMAAMIQAGVSKLVYCAGDDVGESYGWSTEYLYERMQRDFGNQGIDTTHLPLDEKTQVFELYKEQHGKGNNEQMKG